MLKHDILSCALAAIKQATHQKIHYLETHAGDGLYDLQQAVEQGRNEWREGIGYWQTRNRLNGNFSEILKRLNRHHSSGGPGLYPGSPWLAARILDGNDGISLYEVSGVSISKLEKLFVGDDRVSIYHADGFHNWSRSHEAGMHTVVFADPAYKDEDDVSRAANMIRTIAHHRSCYTVLLWYPLLKADAFADLKGVKCIESRQAGAGMLVAGDYQELASTSVYTDSITHTEYEGQGNGSGE